MPSLRDSILSEGVLVPLEVRKRKEGGYWIVWGVRRFKAGGMAELKTFPCIVVDIDEEEAMSRQFAENRDREGHHPLDVALYCGDFANQGRDHNWIAKRLHLKKRDVVQKLRLLALSPAARKAFVAGKFDEDAAVALTTTSDPAKQADVLAALDAGSLQAEEIVGYIRRTFTAPLDDVPWRVSDEKLVAKAGACGPCPKRSDVQRDMFPRESTGLRCLDVDCWRSKMEATWKIELARPGVVLFDQQTDSVFAVTDSRPSVIRSSGMVDADVACPHMTTTRTWREAVFSALPEGAEPPTVYLARDQDGRPRFLMREATVSRIVKRSPGARRDQDDDAPAKTPAGAQPSPAGDAGATSRRAENRIRRSMIQTFAERVVSGDHDTWAWVVDRMLDGATPRSLSAAADLLEDSIRGLDQDGLTAKGGLAALAATANRQARRVATAIMIFEEADVVGEISESLHALAKSCDLDLATIEREIRSPA
jgi:ParB/RepB/Spo0J family partition protein